MSRRADQSERLERALDGGPIPHDEESRRMLAAAGSLRPDDRRNPARVRATREAMLRAYEHAQNPPEARDDAGTDDGVDEPEIHRQEIDLPGGGQLVLTDIEPISHERAEKTAAHIAHLLQRSDERDRQR